MKINLREFTKNVYEERTMRIILLSFLFMVSIFLLLPITAACPNGHITCYYTDKDKNNQNLILAQTTGTCGGAPHGLYGCWACDTHSASTQCKNAVIKAPQYVSGGEDGYVQALGWGTEFDSSGNLTSTAIVPV